MYNKAMHPIFGFPTSERYIEGEGEGKIEKHIKIRLSGR